MLQRLVGHLHGIFDKNPAPVPVLYARHPEGFAWQVNARTLTVKTNTGRLLGVYPLSGRRILEVRDWLLSLGCSVDVGEPTFLSRLADSLLDGENNEGRSNGDRLSSYNTILYSLLDSYAIQLERAEIQIGEALRQMSIPGAEANWLDYWGQIFGIPREDAELDPDYRNRIIAETLRPRSNPVAISQTVKALTKKSVFIREPYKEMFVLGESRMNDQFHFQDGQFFTRNVIQPFTYEPVDFKRPLEIIQRNKPAGTFVADPLVLFRPRLVEFGDVGLSDAGREDTSTHFGRGGEAALSVFMPLSGYDITRNWDVTLFEARVREVPQTIMVDGQVLEPPRNISRATVCLSDGDRLGDLNTVFGYGYSEYFTGSELLSGSADSEGLRLSDVLRQVTEYPQDEILEEVRSESSFLQGLPTVKNSGLRFSSELVEYPTVRLGDDLKLSDVRREHANYGLRNEGRYFSATGLGFVQVLSKNIRTDIYGRRMDSGISATQGFAGVEIVSTQWATRLGDDAYWRGYYTKPGRTWFAEPRYNFDGTPLVPDSYIPLPDFVRHVELVASYQEVLRASAVRAVTQTGFAVKYPDQSLGGMPLSNYTFELIDVGLRTDLKSGQYQFDLFANQTIELYQSVYRSSVSLSDGVALGEADARFDYPEALRSSSVTSAVETPLSGGPADIAVRNGLTVTQVDTAEGPTGPVADIQARNVYDTTVALSDDPALGSEGSRFDYPTEVTSLSGELPLPERLGYGGLSDYALDSESTSSSQAVRVASVVAPIFPAISIVSAVRNIAAESLVASDDEPLGSDGLKLS